MAENQFKTLEDIVFEHKNKNYGAYRLRSNQDSYLLKAFLIGTAVFIIFVLSMFLYSKWKLAHGKPDVAIVVNMTDLNFKQKEEEEPKEIKPEEKIPTKQEPIAQIKMVMPTLRKDNMVKVEGTIPPADSTKNKQVGSTNEKGSTSPNPDITFNSGPPPPPTIKPPIDDNKVFDGNVDQEAVYPGGTKALTDFIASNLDYPQKALDNGTQGRVSVKFVVEKDGSVSGIQVTKDIGDGCGDEVVRVLKRTKKWTPAKVNGLPVRSYFRLPVTFRLPE